MRYTSPRVTSPKKSSLIMNHGEDHGEGGDNDDATISSPVRPINNLLAQPSLYETHSPLEPVIVAPLLTKDNIAASNNIHYDYSKSSTSISENDSAVVNISDDNNIEPRPKSNLLALLNSGGGTSTSTSTSTDGCRGEEVLNNRCEVTESCMKITGESKTQQQHLHNIKTETGCTIIKEGISNDDEMDFDDTTNNNAAANQMNASISDDNMNIPHNPPEDGVVSLQESTQPRIFEFHRSTSMEPLVGQSSIFQPGIKQTTSSDVQTTCEKGEVAKLDSPKERRAKPTFPIIYDVSNEYPPSPLMVPNINSGVFSAPSSANTTSEIGGDTYFDHLTPNRTSYQMEEKKGADTFYDDDDDDDNNNDDDDLAQITLPPRVSRKTTLTGYTRGGDDNNTTAVTFPSTPTRDLAASMPPPHPLSPPYPLSPRQQQYQLQQQHQFAHTHSLLDDSSDEEGEMTSFRIVDSPDRSHLHSYSCLPRAQHASNSEGGSPFSSYFRKQQRQDKKNIIQQSLGGSNATKVASNNIQQALLQTRHRRWEIQSSFAGSHAQSKEVFDISHRFYFTTVARLSVSIEAIRAAALSSGLWRSVRLVKLPKGLIRPSAHSNNIMKDNANDDRGIDNDIWALLKMLHSTFPVLDQLDFGGDISNTKPLQNSSGDETIAKSNAKGDDEWSNMIISCIMECLPNVVAIDGWEIVTDTTDKATLSSTEIDLEEDANATLNGAKIDAATKEDSNAVTLDNDEKKVSPTSSSSSALSTSQSWGSTNSSSSRPPTCPNSTVKNEGGRQQRLPIQPRKKSKEGTFVKASGRLKRKVLALIPSASIMDDEEEANEENDEDDSTCDCEDSEETEHAKTDDCPTDLL